jgi:tripartite-type tricarboxylate transporter receptor subunit TctC
MRAIIGLAFSLVLLASGAFAQANYPEQTIRILVGFPAGTAPDVVGRAMVDKLTVSLGKPVVIENVTGANGNIACDRAAKSQPDGYTLVLCGNGSLIFGPSLYDKLPFNPTKDFVPITQVFVAANILVVHPDVPAKSLPELVALAKAKPGELTYAHTGIGSSQHLAAELFKSMAGLDIRPVGYRGSTALLPDLLAGRITMGFTNIVNAAPLVKEGKLRGFAVTSRKRSQLVPELPTMQEAGYPGYEAVPWFGLMAPPGTPQPILDRLYRESIKVLAMPDVRRSLENQGLDVIGSTPAELADVIKMEIPYWAKIIKEAGIKPSE